MKNSLQFFFSFIAIFFMHNIANGQTHKSNLATTGTESMPMNRAAFIYCYNNNASYSNPATAVLKTKVNHKTTPVLNKQTISSENISMFSNSTEDELWVQIKSESVHEKELQLEIFNASGERVYNTSIQQNLHRINVCDFSAGTFLVKLGDTVRKLVIE